MSQVWLSGAGESIAIDDRYTLPCVLAARAAESPDKDFLIEADSGRSVTYAEADAAARAWAHLLHVHGVQSGDTVLTVMNWRTEAVTVWCGIAHLRAIDVTVSPAMRGRSLVHQVNLSQAHTVVTDPDGLALLSTVGEELSFIRQVIVLDAGAEVLPSDSQWRLLKAEDALRTLPAGAAAEFQPATLSDVARLTFTSGTTGPAKAVIIPWGSVVQGAVSSMKSDYSSDERIYITSPANHITGRMLVHFTALLGATAILRPHFRTGNFWLDVNQYRCTMTTLVAAMADFVFDQPTSDADADSTLRFVNMVPAQPWHEQFAKRFGVKVTSGYGQSEAVKVLSFGWEIEDFRSCGRPHAGWPGLELRIVDQLDYEVPDGQVGELIVRSAVPWTLNLGYFRDPVATSEAWRNGWFHTGDMFRRDERGLYFFVDRARDAIRRRGVNIASFDVEAEVNAHPEVRECAAIGVPIGENEEEIKVFVVLNDGATIQESDLIGFLESSAPRHMIPRFVQFIDSLPRNESQRVQKFVLRAAPADAGFDREKSVYT